MEASNDTFDIEVPEQISSTLTFCEPNSKSLESWVHQLPMANLGETTKQLYRASQEISQLIIPAHIKYELLETVRPAIYFACRGLEKYYLNQSVVLAEKPRKTSQLAKSLRNHLANGYKAIAVDCAEKKRLEVRAEKAMSCAIHRAVNELSYILLMNFQLYKPADPRLWLEMHQLYLMAAKKRLLMDAITDPENTSAGTSTISDVYKRALLIGCANPNKLRQKDMVVVFDALPLWTKHTSLDTANDTDILFLVDLSYDVSPAYGELTEDILHDNCRSLETTDLVHNLREYVASKSAGQEPHTDIESTVPKNCSLELIKMLALAWGVLTKRTFSRNGSTGQLSICLGLSATHYFVSGGMCFDHQLRGGQKEVFQSVDDNPFLHPHPSMHGVAATDSDPWSNAFDAGGNRIPQTPDVLVEPPSSLMEPGPKDNTNEKKFCSHTVNILNTSPGGFCIGWNGEMPSLVQAGEILGIKESGQSTWSIGVIRWLSQPHDGSTEMGLELLSPTATPCGARLISTQGEPSEYMRALILPELEAINQPATLVTPTLTFEADKQVYINQFGAVSRLKLSKRSCTTGSFCQFQFETIHHPQDDPPKSKPDADDFDSLWSNL